MSERAAGDVIADRYDLLSPIRAGGSGEVWQAIDRDTGHFVAIKFAADARHLAHQFAWLEQLDHPGFVDVIRVNTEPPFLVMEWVEGNELRDLMGAEPRIWAPVVRTAIDALHYAHAKGLAHGDLSLHNIVTGDDGRARLLDPGETVATTNDDLRALGDMLYSLVTGLPPGEPATDRVQPLSLARLIDRLRSNNLTLTLSDVATELDRLLTENQSQSEQFERIDPMGRDAVARVQSTTQPEKRSYVWVGFAAAALVAVVAAVLLPRAFEPADVSSTASNETAPSAASLRLSELQSEVRETRDRVYKNWLKLESMDVGRWAGRRAEHAQARLQQGELLAGDFKLTEALRDLREAESVLQQLIEEAPQVGQFHRDAGWQAFHAANGEQAVEHFRTVLAIGPEDPAIRDAMRRAQYLDRTAAYRREATRLENSGDYVGAVAQMQTILTIDPQDQTVAAEIARLQQAISNEEFSKVMSAAHEHLQKQRFGQARTALRQAAILQPDSAAVRDARIQLEVSERTAHINKLKQKAEVAESQQQWSEAIALFSELLQLDDALVFAQQGRDRARLLASLTARAQSMLEGDDLLSDEARRQAVSLAAQIAKVQADAPELKGMGRDLEDAIKRAGQPVTVVLQSDNQTEVTIFRVGPLGRFDRQQIELLPGRYTVMGSCDGFRDVRQELVVQAGAQLTPLTIRCKERI